MGIQVGQDDITVNQKSSMMGNNREQIIMEHLPLVKFVIGRLGVFSSNDFEYEDLLNQGIIGLIEALDHFDTKYGTQFSTYATLKIRSKVLDYLRELDWMPRTTRDRVKKVKSAISHLEKEFHREPTDNEIAEFLDMDIDSLQKTLADTSRVVVSLDADDQINQDSEDALPLYDRLMDHNQVDPLIQVEEHDFHSLLVEKLKELPEREQMILSLYYYDRLTFKEIGEVLDISESRICQIHGKTVLTLKALMEREI